MKKKLLFAFIALMSIMNAMSITIVPTTSTPGNDVWYMIKCNPRDPANPLATWLSVLPNDSLIYSNYSGGDEQLWKVVENPNGAGGVALVNKKSGYLNSDARSLNGKPRQRLSTQATIPATPLKFVPSTGYPALSWPGWDTTTPGVFIVSNSAALSVSATNTFTVNSFEEAFNLAIYSPASGAYLMVVTNPSWAGNLNSVVLFRTQEEVVAEVKATLLSKITTVNTAYNNSSEGFNPGQVSTDDRITLKSTIDAAQFIYDDASSNIQNYLDAVNELNSIYDIFKTQVILPELSITTDNWYYIEGTRPTGTYMTAPAAGSAAQVKNLAVIPDDTQLWKLVPSGNGFVMQNKSSQEYLQTDVVTNTNLITQTAMPTKVLRFITSGESTNNTSRFWIENTNSSTEAFRLYSGSDAVMNNTSDANSFSTWLFISENEIFRAQFTTAKNNARALYAASIEGTEFGQYTTDKRTAFLSIITTEEAKDLANMSQDDLKAATKTLNDAIAAYNCNDDVTTLSSITKIKWFRIVNAMQPANGYAAGKAMSSTGRTVDTEGYLGKYTFLTKNVNTDDQLFRFELNSDGTKATTLVNKGNGKYVGSNGAIVSTPTPDVEFEISRLDINSFWIKPTSASPLHAAASNTEILNWNSGAGSASAWKLEYVKSEDVTDFTNTYTSTRTQTRAKYDAALLVSGNQIGQYSASIVGALGSVITAEEVKVVATLTQTEMLQGINDMISAVAALEINTDIKLLVSPTANTVKWFRLINNMSGTGYASGMAMSSNGRIETEAFTFETKDVNSDAQLFRFELNAAENKVAKMYNKGAGLYMSPTGTMLADDAIVQITNEFDITQLSGGRSFWIHPTYIDATDPAAPFRVDPLHAANSGTTIVNWNAGAGSASAWIFEFVTEETTAVKNAEAFTYKVRTNNNIITVDGVENFEVYSVLGQKQNSKKALNNGVYFVKVNNAIKKVIIK